MRIIYLVRCYLTTHITDCDKEEERKRRGSEKKRKRGMQKREEKRREEVIRLKTRKTPSSRFVAAQAATRLPSLPATWLACTPAIARAGAGKSRCRVAARELREATRRLCSASQATACMALSNMRAAFTVCSVCRVRITPGGGDSPAARGAVRACPDPT